MPGSITQIGGLSLLRVPFLDIAVGFQVIVAAFALLGRPSSRRQDHRIGADLLRMPTPGHLALLFAPPLLLACGGILTAVTRRRPRTVMSADP
jgi:hypothetical protein